MNLTRNPVATFALLGAGLSSLLTGAGAVANRRQKRGAYQRRDHWGPTDIENFGYPTGEEGEAPDVDQQLIGDIQDVLIIRPRGLE